MTQVNSEPGVSQVPPTIVVPTVSKEVGAENAKAAAVAKVVPYMQSEPGKSTATNPTRS